MYFLICCVDDHWLTFQGLGKTVGDAVGGVGNTVGGPLGNVVGGVGKVRKPLNASNGHEG